MSKKHKTTSSRKGRSSARRSIPQYWRNAKAGVIQRQILADEREQKRIRENRAASGQVMEYCVAIAENDLLELDKDALQCLMAEANRQAGKFSAVRHYRGGMTARKELEAATNPLFDKPYMIKAGPKPNDNMSNKTWQLLFAQQRSAADLVLRFNARAMEALKYSREQINDVLAEAVNNYAQFLEWAEFGEDVAYEKLRRIVEQMLDEPAYLERVGDPEPIFAKEF
jgi:hypothetical protein